MNRVWIICLTTLCFSSAALLGTAMAASPGAAAKKLEKKTAKVTQSPPAPKKVTRPAKTRDRFIDRNKNGVNDRKAPKVVKPRATERKKPKAKSEPESTKEEAPPR